MEIISLLLLIVMLILVISLRSSFDNKLQLLQTRMEYLLTELTKLRNNTTTPNQKDEAVKPPVEAKPDVQWSHKPPETIVKKEEPAPKAIEEINVEPLTPVPAVSPIAAISKPVLPPPVAQTKRPSVPPNPGFFERNPDLEKFIGENLANKIGIGILVLGIGFFVKFAIDQNWINEIGRVFIGILCGGILVGLAHRLRKAFSAFSSVLVGGGIAILYLTVTIAFHEYHIFSQTSAFVIMVLITGFTIFLSIGYNRIELALLAILGGFGSPFMVSTGEGNYVVLFSYILILDAGMLVLAYYKKWNLVNLVSYIFTILLFGSWLAARFEGENTSMILGALLFATAFYLVFFAMNIVNNLKERAKFQAIELSMLLSNTFLYYAAGMAILDSTLGVPYKGLFTASLGIFNFIFAFLLYKNNKADKNLVFTLIGLVLTFVSLAAPIQLEGNYITLFWAAETVLLLWLSQKSGIRLMKIASLIVMFLMVISLIMDWDQLYFNYESALSILLNKAYITGIVTIASFAGTLFLLKNESSEDVIPVKVYSFIITIAAIAATFALHLLELRFHLIAGGVASATKEVIIAGYSMFFIILLMLTERKLTVPPELKKAFVLWGFFAVLLYLFFYQLQIIEIRNDYVYKSASSFGFIFHYIYVALLIVVVILSIRRTEEVKAYNLAAYNLSAWFYVFFFVFLASAELDHAVALIAYSGEGSIGHILTQNHKIGFPILWGISSFTLIVAGLRRKLKQVRIISLSLFTITLLKLFIVDIRGISEGGKIAAFISLGILLLIVSFMYQRLKKIILADEATADMAKKS